MCKRLYFLQACSDTCLVQLYDVTPHPALADCLLLPGCMLRALSTSLLLTATRPRPAPCHNNRVRVLQLHPRPAAMP
jgi:hypothetical protein